MPRLGDSSLGKSVNIKASALPFTQVSVEDLGNMFSSINQTQLSGKRQGAGFFSSEYSLCVATGPLSTDPWVCTGGQVISPANPDAAPFSVVAVGEETGGGIYAGTDTIDGTEYHIVSGDSDSEASGLKWKTELEFTDGTDSETDGLANTLAMEVAGLDLHPAADHCLSYRGGEHIDWHMPASSQLTLIYNNLAGHPSFSDNVGSNSYTWSSTEVSSTSAVVRNFSSGQETFVTKHSNYRVRPIRRIPV